MISTLELIGGGQITPDIVIGFKTKQWRDQLNEKVTDENKDKIYKTKSSDSTVSLGEVVELADLMAIIGIGNEPNIEKIKLLNSLLDN